MSAKKWFSLFIAALFLVILFCVSLNILVDPFGVFNTGVMRWDSYSQTLNPRIAKAIYIEKHLDEFDSYIIGSSSAASYLPQTLHEYTGGTYYNMFHYGADIAYDRSVVSYLIENDHDIKNIVLVLGLTEAANTKDNSSSLSDQAYYKVTKEKPLLYYRKFAFCNLNYSMEKLLSRCMDTVLPKTFDVFLPESGTYDKSVRDVESIGSMADYLSVNNESFPAAGGEQELQNIDGCVENVAAIRDMCKTQGIDLKVILTPALDSQLQTYSQDSIKDYYTALAQVVDYWNFQISPISSDVRYFYDTTHTRNATANMVLARLYGDKEKYYPDAFGYQFTGSEQVSVSEMYANRKVAQQKSREKTVPILLFHSIDDTKDESGAVLHTDTFAHYIKLLADTGYTPISLQSVIDFVDKGKPLPEHPVAITFDDGYQSNYENAFPILKKFGFPATIFVIGSSVGHGDYYKDTKYQMTPHFGQKEIADMLSSGLISIQSHTYDMHQWPDFEDGVKIRANILPLVGESQKKYIAFLEEDVALQDQLFQKNGLDESNILAFPEGKFKTVTDVVLRKCGYKMTLTTDGNRVNTVVAGLGQSLIDLGRMNIDQNVTDKKVLSYLHLNEN